MLFIFLFVSKYVIIGRNFKVIILFNEQFDLKLKQSTTKSLLSLTDNYPSHVFLKDLIPYWLTNKFSVHENSYLFEKIRLLKHFKIFISIQ